MASEIARQTASQAWCKEKTSGKEMDADLAEAFAEIIDEYRDALIWVGGSMDYAPNGKARKGYLEIQAKLID